MTETAVLLDIRDNVAWVTLNRPEALNAMSPALLHGIAAAVDGIEADFDVRAVVFTGAGRAFCAGGDLAFFKTAINDDPQAFVRFAGLAQHVLRRVEMLPMPVIAAVNGVAVAGGLELILCCDLVIAVSSAQIGDGHANFGIIPGGGSSIRLPRKIPTALAKRLLLTGNLLPAQTLKDYGLVNEVVPDDQLMAEVEKLVAEITKNSPLGLRWIKKLVNDGLEQPLDTALRSETNAFESYVHSDDIMEGLNAFEAKRAPKFTGR
ncbi:MAG: enoyl-CoA hydratase/isomerase family protein [Rhodospirillales bacterium]|nr:enoyl-CoA hydratase/isomerase family protein [Rhodospirillales bacterium]